jgi:hypothetical protein
MPAASLTYARCRRDLHLRLNDLPELPLQDLSNQAGRKFVDHFQAFRQLETGDHFSLEEGIQSGKVEAFPER